MAIPNGKIFAVMEYFIHVKVEMWIALFNINYLSYFQR